MICEHNQKIKTLSSDQEIKDSKILLVLSPDLDSLEITNKPLIVRAKESRNTSLEGS